MGTFCKGNNVDTNGTLTRVVRESLSGEVTFEGDTYNNCLSSVSLATVPGLQ